MSDDDDDDDDDDGEFVGVYSSTMKTMMTKRKEIKPMMRGRRILHSANTTTFLLCNV
jgi:hypothetical protein